jgi:cell division protein FtsL
VEDVVMKFSKVVTVFVFLFAVAPAVLADTTVGEKRSAAYLAGTFDCALKVKKLEKKSSEKTEQSSGREARSGA